MAHCWLSPEVGIIIDVIGMREMEGAVMSSCCRHCHVIMSWEKTRERKRKRGGHVVVVRTEKRVRACPPSFS